MAGEAIQVLIVAAYPAVRAGLRAMLEAAEDIAVVGAAAPGALSEVVAAPAIDVLVVDLAEDAESLIAATAGLLARAPAVLLAADPEDVRALAAGASAPRAYLLRDVGAEELAAAVQAVVRGLIVLDPAVARAALEARAQPIRTPPQEQVEALTEREQDVLRLLALGLPNKGIALRLGISEHTVKFHVGAILAKLGAAGRTEAVMSAARRGLLPL